jgi:hypothetical protein
MSTFSTSKVLNGDPALIPEIADRIVREFQMEGFTAKSDSYAGGVYDISLAKGNAFKAVLGMKSALKVSLTPQGNAIHINAGVGIFGQQAIPTAITMFVFWPVLIPQIWGLVQQAKLDDRAIAIAEQVVMENSRASYTNARSSFCPNCGGRISGDVNFCPSCGEKLN